jgi:hypothetical protein
MNRKLKNYFETALAIADNGKVKRLFASLGYRDYQKITPEMCVEALNAHGSKFSQPFGMLAKSALSTPKVESYMAAHGIINSVEGVTVQATGSAPTTLPLMTTPGTKPKTGSNWLTGFETITNFLVQGTSSAATLLDTIKGRGMLDSEAQLTEAQAKLEASKKTNWVPILAIIGVIVAVVVGIVIFKKK